MQDIISRLTPIMRRVFNDPNIVVNNELSANDVEKWTSMTNIVFINEVEKEFGFTFHFTEIMDLENVGDLLKVIKNKTS